MKYAVFMWCIIIYVLKSYVFRTICNLNNLPIFFDQFHNFGTSWEWVILEFTTVNFFFFSYVVHIPYKKCLKNFITCILFVYWKLYPHSSTRWPTKMYPFFFVDIFKKDKYFLFTFRYAVNKASRIYLIPKWMWFINFQCTKGQRFLKVTFQPNQWF